MSRDPFLRLALIAVCSLYVTGLVTLAWWLGPAAAAVCGVVGVALAAGLTVVLEPAPATSAEADEPQQRRRQPRDGTAGFDREQA